MKISRYGLTLQRLQPAQIEMVRSWRNHPKIAGVMFYTEPITEAMQQRWFESIDNEHNFFFLIYVKDEPVGLINISAIDWETRAAQTGLYIYNDAFLSTDTPVMASLAMLDVFFLLLDIQTVYARVKGDNKTAHNYNTALGFNRHQPIENGQGYEYILHKTNYITSTKHLRHAAIKLKGNGTSIVLNPHHTADARVQLTLNLAPREALENLAVSITLVQETE